MRAICSAIARAAAHGSALRRTKRAAAAVHAAVLLPRSGVERLRLGFLVGAAAPAGRQRDPCLRAARREGRRGRRGAALGVETGTHGGGRWYIGSAARRAAGRWNRVRYAAEERGLSGSKRRMR